MKDGFYAKNYVEELPNENLYVSFMKKQEDVTARVNKLIAGKNAEQTEAILDSLTNHLTDSIKAIDKTLHIKELPTAEESVFQLSPEAESDSSCTCQVDVEGITHLMST